MKKWIIALFIGVVFAYLAYAQPGPIQPIINRFTLLVDTPSAYTGETGKYIRVNAGETALEFVALAGGGDLLADGTVPLTASWNVGSNAIYGLTYIDLTGADASPASTGEIRYDSTVAGINGGAIAWYDNDEIKYFMDYPTLPTDAEDDYHLAYDKDTDKMYWKADADTGGSTAYDDIGDPDASGSISFDAAEGGTYTSAADEWVGITISNTAADNAGDTELLTLAFTDDGDTNSHYLIMSDAAGTQQLEVIQNVADIQITTAGDLKFIAGGGDFNFADDTITTTGTINATTFVGALTGNADTCTTASAGDAAVDFFGAGVTAVTDATACTDIEGTGLSIAAGTLNWAAASTDLTDTADLLYELELDTFAELDAQIADKSLVNMADGATWLGNHDFGGADLEIPQASPAVPDADGEIEYDFTDGKLVIQHGSAHAELAGSTDVALTGLIKSFSGTIFQPDTVNDVITVKAINSIEFPHGIVVTAVYLGISSDTTYTLTVQNFDDFDTINGVNPTIDAVTYTADTTGEIIDTTPTYATIAAGQIIMISIPATDVDWIHFEIYFYEPAA